MPVSLERAGKRILSKQPVLQAMIPYIAHFNTLLQGRVCVWQTAEAGVRSLQGPTRRHVVTSQKVVRVRITSQP
jgi:hypothetical protein